MTHYLSYLAVFTTVFLLGCQSAPISTQHIPISHSELSGNSAQEQIESFKVIGYISARHDHLLASLEMKLPYVTHINYAFANPTEDGSGELQPFDREKFGKAVAIVKAANKKIFLSFGGWQGDDDGYDLAYEKIAADAAAKAIFINNIMQLVREYDLDGIDMDWEYPRVQYADEYADFIEDLAKALQADQKLLTAAVIGTKTKVTDSGDGAAYLDRAVKAFDWLNLMAYDVTPDDHSPYSAAQDSLDYWLGQRQLPANKAVLGLPMYARPSWRTYSAVIADNPSLACVDSVNFEGKTDYYNGLPTIKKKTQLAVREKLAGVMVWELPQDASDANLSIMKAIVDAAFHSEAMGYCDAAKSK